MDKASSFKQKQIPLIIRVYKNAPRSIRLGAFTFIITTTPVAASKTEVNSSSVAVQFGGCATKDFGSIETLCQNMSSPGIFIHL